MTIDLPRSRDPRVSVIIPASSSPDLLRACLHSLASYVPSHIPYEAIVVLNMGVQDEVDRLKAEVTGLEVVAPPVNLGLAGAGNRGRSLAQGEFLVLLHDDAEIEPGWLEALIETAERHPEAGAVGGKVLDPDGTLQSAGMILWRDATTSPPWFGEPPEPSAFSKLRAVDYCGTSSLLVRASAWDAIGGLSERFYPVYYVDVDLAMALRQLGLTVLYQPASRIRHHRGASGSHHFRNFVCERNRHRFIDKWNTALEQHDTPGSDPALAMEQAMSRAEAFADSCRGRNVPATPKRAPFDPAMQDLRHLWKSRALQSAYAAHLSDLSS